MKLTTFKICMTTSDTVTLIGIKFILICFPMNYRDFSMKINGENNSEITIFIFTVCKKRSFDELLAKSLAQKV